MLAVEERIRNGGVVKPLERRYVFKDLLCSTFTSFGRQMIRRIEKILFRIGVRLGRANDNILAKNFAQL